MKIRNNYTCPLEFMSDILSGKWKNIILWKLRVGKQSLSTLNKGINGISEKMLIQHLNELIEYKIVAKNIYNEYPRRVEYFLTEVGKEVIKGVEIFQNIAIEYYLDYFQIEDEHNSKSV